MKKILIAEDDAIVRKLLVKAIESAGHMAIQTSNGSLAWDIIKDNNDISLLITDVMMPNMNGKELVQIIRGNESTKELPVIIISGVVAFNEISGLLELGASRFMPKPVDTKELKRYIDLLIK